MKITVVEDILARVPTFNTGTGERQVQDLLLKDDVMTTIDIPDVPTNRFYPFTLQTRPLYIKQQVRKVLRNRILSTLQENLHKDVGFLTVEEVGSPPVIIEYPDEVNWEQFARDNVDATFRIVSTGNTGGVMFGEERVFRVNAPSWLKYKSNSFYQTQSKELTCGYEYLVKFSSDKRNSCYKNGKSKQAIDTAIQFQGYKGDIYHQIYNNWWEQNRTKIEADKPTERQIHPIPEYISVGDLYDEDGLYKVEECDITPKYSEYDIERTLSVKDLLRWCIASNIRLSVFDYDDTDYLSYNPADFYAEYPDIKRKKQRGSIVVKVANSHAYFVEDKDIKTSVSQSKTRHKMKLEDESWSKQKDKDPKDESSKKDLKVVSHDNLTDYDFCPEDKPPPTLNELEMFMKDKGAFHHYYVGVTNLNGLVSVLYNRGFVPDKLTGTAHTIHNATFGHLKLLSSRTKYERAYDENFSDLYELYPDLKSPYGIQPTTTTIGKYLLKKIDPDESYLSMMNPQVKRMFYESEIKPDVRKCKYESDGRDTVMGSSFDLDKAYTNALLHNEYEWNVYDVISQPKKYRGRFNPSYFYLCINKTQEYPCIVGKGLILYHGSLLKYCLDKVDIKYYIPPKKTLPIDYFKPFVAEAVEFASHSFYLDKEEKEKLKLPTSSKQLINNTIGSLKNKDGIQQYGLYIHTDKKAVSRHFLKDYLPSRLKSGVGLTWNKEPILTSKPQRLNHFENGQPIRLQVISVVSAMNYLVYLHYKKCLYDFKVIVDKEWTGKKQPIYYDKPTLYGVNTDAIKVSTPLDSDIDWDAWNTTDTHLDEVSKVWTKKRPMDYFNQKFEKYVVDTFNSENTFKIKVESRCDPNDIVESIPQLSMVYLPNQWEIDYSVSKQWERNEHGKLLIQSAIHNRGGWFAGLGGRGKTELIKRMKEMCDENKKLYRWVKLVSRMIEGNTYDIRQKYLDINPITCIGLAPTNKSANLIEGKTLHKGLGVMVKDIDDDEDEEQVKDIKPYLKSVILKMEGDRRNGIHPIGILAIDEISMMDGEMWSYIAYIRERLPNLTIMLFGDIDHQLPPPKEELRHFAGAYAIKCIANFMKITLNYNFRQERSGDLLWEKAGDPSNFEIEEGELTDLNLCWLNATRKRVIEEVQDKHHSDDDEMRVIEYEPKSDTDDRQTLKYHKGTPMIARKSFHSDDIRVAKNEMWMVTNLEPLILAKTDDGEETDCKIEIDEDILFKNFLSGYCITIHKAQGETYDRKYCIHDWNKIDRSRIARKLRYTAISRSKNPEKNISFRV